MVQKLTLSESIPVTNSDPAAVFTAFKAAVDALTLPAWATAQKSGLIPSLRSLDTDTTSPASLYVNIDTDGTQTQPQMDSLESQIRAEAATAIANNP